VRKPETTFPRRLRAHPLQESDGTFFFLLLLITALLVPLIMHLRSLPPAALTQREREKYLRVIYRAPAVPAAEQVAPPSEEAAAPEVERPEIPEHETPKQRTERRKREAIARAARHQAQIEHVRTLGVFAVAGALKPGYDLGLPGGAIGISGGSLEGLEARSREEIAVRPDVSNLAALKEKGMIREDAGLPESDYAVTPDTVTLARAEVRLDALPIIRGHASPDSARDVKVLRKAIQVQLEGLQGCYFAQKRRDGSLRGQLMARVTVAVDGTVRRARLRESRWSNPALGRRVEACLEQRILAWEFDPAEGGDVTVEFPLVFGGK